MHPKTNYQRSHAIRMVFMIVFINLSLTSRSVSQIYLDSTAALDARVSDLLSKMTLEEKIGQMVQMHYANLPASSDISTYFLGSLLAYADNGPAGRTPQAWADLYDTLQSYALQTRLKIPMIFAVDAIHGFGAMYGATVFPHNIGLGCTRNDALVQQAAHITAQEMSATGVDWTLGPVVAVARDERWGRTYESFGEDPALVKWMSAAAVRGFQGDTSAKNVAILACAKHFIGDGGTTGGVNNANTQVDEAALRAIHLPGYISAMEQNVGSIMIAQNQWNGIHCHGSPFLLTTLLKEELGFKGLVISDANSFLYAGEPSVPFPTVIRYGAAIQNSINAGVDMAMISNYGGYNHRTYIDTLKGLINKGSVSIARIDDAVKRILAQKFRLGLFEHPYATRSLLSQVGSPEHRQVARECVRQSLVVLKKKDTVLPISKKIKRIHMAGRHANNLGYQCGGWTMTWQGGSGTTTIGTTIMQAVQQAVPAATVTYSEDGFGADSADIGIAVIGELPYAEYVGDGRVSLDSKDVQAIRNLKSYNIPVIVILVSGRPMIINPILHHCDALIAAWLPGSEGQGVSDVLFGDYPPVGILSQSWPRDISQIPINVGDIVYKPLFEYGYGITSLNDSPAGSPPELYSVSTTSNKNIELSFTKNMTAPPAAPSGFSVAVNGSVPVQLTQVNLKNNDSTKIILTLESSIVKGSTYTLSYSPGTIHSNDGGQLAAVENTPVYNIINDYSYVHDVPKKIEAEESISRQGFTVLSCSDAGGGQCFANIKNGSSADYYVNVTQSGKYILEYRASSIADTGQIQLFANGALLSTLNVPLTGSSDTWQSFATTVELSEGPQFMRMNALRGGFWLNWIQFALSTGVEEQVPAPQRFQLFQNYPNPFNPSTTISYQLPVNAYVSLKLYDPLGREIETLVSGLQNAGSHVVDFNAGNLPSGVYFYRIQTGAFMETKKLILMK